MGLVRANPCSWTTNLLPARSRLACMLSIGLQVTRVGEGIFVELRTAAFLALGAAAVGAAVMYLARPTDKPHTSDA